MKTLSILSFVVTFLFICLSAKSQTLQFSQVVTLSGTLSNSPGGTPSASFSPPANKVWKIESILLPSILRIHINDVLITGPDLGFSSPRFIMAFPIWIDSDDTIFIDGTNSFNEDYFLSIIEFNNQ